MKAVKEFIKFIVFLVAAVVLWQYELYLYALLLLLFALISLNIKSFLILLLVLVSFFIFNMYDETKFQTPASFASKPEQIKLPDNFDWQEAYKKKLEEEDKEVVCIKEEYKMPERKSDRDWNTNPFKVKIRNKDC